MISHIKGDIKHSGPGYIVLECNNIGYKITVPKSFFISSTQNGHVTVYTCLLIRDNDISLYGFRNMSERELFERLLMVSGLGAKTALSILSTFSPEQFYAYILNEDLKAISSIPGIGSKTARRLIFELKDKLKDVSRVSNIEVRSGAKQEALMALEALGWTAAEAIEIIDKINVPQDTAASEIIRIALRQSGKSGGRNV